MTRRCWKSRIYGVVAAARRAQVRVYLWSLHLFWRRWVSASASIKVTHQLMARTLWSPLSYRKESSGKVKESEKVLGILNPCDLAKVTSFIPGKQPQSQSMLEICWDLEGKFLNAYLSGEDKNMTRNTLFLHSDHAHWVKEPLQYQQRRRVLSILLNTIQRRHSTPGLWLEMRINIAIKLGDQYKPPYTSPSAH